jgi:hypothetical protein
MIDLVFGELDVRTDGAWRPAMRDRNAEMRQALLRHRWAVGRMEAGTPGPESLRHHNATMACLRERAGLPFATAVHAYSVMDSYVYGFALTESALPIHGPEPVAEVAGSMMRQYPADAYPHLVEFTVAHVIRPGYDFGDEFPFGLDLILDGLARSLPGRPGS